MNCNSEKKKIASRRDFLRILYTSITSIILTACGLNSERETIETQTRTPDPTLTKTPNPTPTETSVPTPSRTPRPTPTLPPIQDTFYITPHVEPLSKSILNDMRSRLGRGNEVKLGFAHDVWYLKQSEGELVQSLRSIFVKARDTNLPVFLQVNGGPFGGIPASWLDDDELIEWNVNLERISNPSAYLGRQFVALNHRTVVREKRSRLRIVGSEVATFYRENPTLLAGLGTDSEQHIDDDAGYNAAEISRGKGPSDPLYSYLSNMDDFREHLIHSHVEFLAKTIYDRLEGEGIPNPEKLIYTHQVGDDSVWGERNDPGWTAFNQYSRPGFTLYGNNAINIPYAVLSNLSQHNNPPWASEEWHPWREIRNGHPVPLSADLWEYSLANMIRNNCRVIVVYGWNILNFPGGITEYLYDDSSAVEGIRRILSEYIP